MSYYKGNEKKFFLKLYTYLNFKFKFKIKKKKNLLIHGQHCYYIQILNFTIEEKQMCQIKFNISFRDGPIDR